MEITHKATSNERSSRTMLENHSDTTTMLMEMRHELEDLKRKNVEEVENLKQENLKSKRKLVESVKNLTRFSI